MSKENAIEIIEEIRRYIPLHPDYKESPIEAEYLTAMRSVPFIYAVYKTKIYLLDKAVEEINKSTVDIEQIEETFETFKKLLPSPDYPATWWAYTQNTNLITRLLRELRKPLKCKDKM